MSWKKSYESGKLTLLADAAICKANRELFREFFEFEEYKLKRRNRLPALDDGCYKTLRLYVNRFHNVNAWFKNKPWISLTREDIKRVYDDLEDGRIRSKSGKPLVDRRSYYNKVFKSKPFQLAGKDQLARDVIEYTSDFEEKVVRFVDEDGFRKLVSILTRPDHLFLFWLAWDIGENINTLLRLKKKHFRLQQNPQTREYEYLVTLPRELLKRSRTSRSEPTIYPETVRFGRMAMQDLGDDEPAFTFGHRHALKLIHASAQKTGVRCQPTSDLPSWKDLRSGMACHLLREGWTTDEVNFRLGHKPSSREIDVYVSYLAIDRSKPKKKLFDSSLAKVQGELDEARARERLLAERLERQKEDTDALRKEITDTRAVVRQVKEALERRAAPDKIKRA